MAGENLTDVPLVNMDDKDKSVHISTEGSLSMQRQGAHFSINKKDATHKIANQNSVQKDTRKM